MLTQEGYEIDPMNYYYSDDSVGYEKEVATKETRIGLLKELIKMIKEKQRL
ncbi:hypothetical protein SMD22_00595 (plasmid) [Brevibacillus halotolerans]|nr:hypothetical protein SMD22_00595 [Brevibacillus halotolerans]